MNQTQLRSIAEKATRRCMDEADGSAWVWEDTIVEFTIEEIIKFLAVSGDALTVSQIKLLLAK